MNDDSPTEAADVQRLRAIAGQVTDEDFRRDEPPAEMWAAIATAMDRPVNEVVTMRRPHRRAWFGVAAAVVAGLLVVGGLVLTRDDDGTVIASTALTNDGLSPLGADSSGEAEIVRRGTTLELHLDIRNVPQEPSGYIEVWLIDEQVEGMISLGPFHGNGDYVIPSGVDPAKYPIIDISIEPPDGVPTHSGVSIVRGVAAS